ncbi:MAG TPA: permease prefix domain 1-containing protein [Terriglobales bacterium]|nr:permease prefix domain 1-containing protein [Terriglobales bacterium]
MRWWQSWKGTAKRDADLERELLSDLELEEEEQRERGLSVKEARSAAQRAFGNTTLIREQTRAAWSRVWLEQMVRDVKYGTRTLLRSPEFAIVSVLVMALGIGATTSLFTMVRAVLLRPLPFRDSSKLVMLYEHYRQNKGGDGFDAVAPGDYRDWRSQTHGFEDMAAMRGMEASSPVCIPNCQKSCRARAARPISFHFSV